MKKALTGFLGITLLSAALLSPSHLFSGEFTKSAVGNVTRLSGVKGIAEPGEEIVITLKSRKKLAVGTQLEIFIVTDSLLEPEKEEGREAEAQLSVGLAVVTKVVGLRKVRAKVTLATSEIEIGNWVRVAQD